LERPFWPENWLDEGEKKSGLGMSEDGSGKTIFDKKYLLAIRSASIVKIPRFQRSDELPS
jgi:hypothetical protein